MKRAIEQGANMNDQDQDNHNTPLHIAIQKGYKEVVEFLLEHPEIRTDIKNGNDKTPLDLAKIRSNREIISFLEAYLQDHSSSSAVNTQQQGSPLIAANQQETIQPSPLSETLFTKVNVPSDGSCLFWAATLAYLIPVKYDVSAFAERFKNLFGEEELGRVQHVQGLIQAYNPLLDTGSIVYDYTFKGLVTNTFCNRVISAMATHYDQFKDSITINSFLHSQRADYVTDGSFLENFRSEFMDEISRYNINLGKLKPSKLDEGAIEGIDGELDKVAE